MRSINSGAFQSGIMQGSGCHRSNCSEIRSSELGCVSLASQSRERLTQLKILCRRDRRRGYRLVSAPSTCTWEILMEARTLNHLPPAGSHDEAVRCLLAIELSKKSWIVAVNTPLSGKIGRHTFQACDWTGLLELIVRIRTRVSQAFNRPVTLPSNSLRVASSATQMDEYSLPSISSRAAIANALHEPRWQECCEIPIAN
jgi:hypothetical protein